MTEIPRREFIAVAGGALATAWLLADPAQLRATAAHVASLGRPARFEVLTATEAEVLEAATSQIIPTDETPGAREARVVHFIDRSIATWAKDQHKPMQTAVRELNARARKLDSKAGSFAALPEERQREVIAALEKDHHEAFNTVRGAAIVGMLSNPEYGGNFEKNGWQMLGFSDRFSWSAPFGFYDR